MKDQLLSVAAYIESLEQRIATLETRCDSLEDELRQRPAHAEDENEPEVELVVDEEEPDYEPEPESETEQVNGTEGEEQQPQEQETEENVTEAPAESQALENESVPAPPPEPELEQALSSEPEPQPEPELEQEPELQQEPAPAPQPQVQPQPQLIRPQQTSIFGAPVSDIRQAISIGDRFLFQRELFGGNGEAMQKMLDRLNGCAGLGEAMDMVAQQPWDRESPTYELFANVLRRRFQ